MSIDLKVYPDGVYLCSSAKVSTKFKLLIPFGNVVETRRSREYFLVTTAIKTSIERTRRRDVELQILCQLDEMRSRGRMANVRRGAFVWRRRWGGIRSLHGDLVI